MIKVITIDDEPLALQQVSAYVQKIPFMDLIASCRSAAEAQRVLETEVIDVIFTDINMPDLSGLDFIRSLSIQPMVVFTTAYSEYAVEGFKADAIDYLLKPFSFTDFQRSAQKVKKQYDLLHQCDESECEVAPADEDDCIFIKSDYRVQRIAIDDILYVEAMSEYLRLHLKDQSRPVTVLLSMKKMEERLPVSTFMRIHRSYIINIKTIREVNKTRVTLCTEESLPIGDNYKEAFFDYINSKFLGR